MSPPTVSVVIPTKNRPELLRRCLRAVADQHCTAEFEVVVVNDAGCRVDDLALGVDERVSVVEGPGRGPAAARNAGIDRASGEIVLFTDDDAIPQPGWIEAAVGALVAAPEAVGVVGRVESPPFDPLYEHSVVSDGAVGNFVTCNVAYRRSALLAVGGFDVEFPYPAAEDRDIGYRLQAVGSVLFEPAMVVVHPPRPVRIRDVIRRGRFVETEWRLHRKHPQTRPPRWSVRWGPLIRMVVHWKRLLCAEVVVRGSCRRAARFSIMACGQLLVAFKVTVLDWTGASKRPTTEPHALGRGANAPLRIAWIGPSPSPGGGVAGCAWLILKALADRGCEIDCYLSTSHEDVSEGLSSLRGVRVVNFDTGWRFDRWYSNHAVTKVLTGQLAMAWSRRRLAPLLLEQHQIRPYDVVYQFSTIELLGLRRHLFDLPSVVVHPETHMAGELRWVRRERHLAARCQPRWRRVLTEGLLAARASRQRRDIQLASRVIAISERFGQHLVADYGVDPHCVVLVPNPIDIYDFCPAASVIGDGPRRIAFVGRISVRKGVELVVELSRRLADLENQVVIDVVGGETLWSDYRPLLEDLNCRIAKYHGPMRRSDLFALLRASDLLVQPAKYEPFGLTVGEALACGVPVVATYEVGAAEGVSSDCCTVVPHGDIEALEKAVRAALERLGRGEGPAMKGVARAEAERLFSPERIGELLFDALSSSAIRQPQPDARPSEADDR